MHIYLGLVFFWQEHHGDDGTLMKSVPNQDPIVRTEIALFNGVKRMHVKEIAVLRRISARILLSLSMKRDPFDQFIEFQFAHTLECFLRKLWCFFGSLCRTVPLFAQLVEYGGIVCLGCHHCDDCIGTSAEHDG